MNAEKMSDIERVLRLVVRVLMPSAERLSLQAIAEHVRASLDPMRPAPVASAERRRAALIRAHGAEWLAAETWGELDEVSREPLLRLAAEALGSRSAMASESGRWFWDLEVIGAGMRRRRVDATGERLEEIDAWDRLYAPRRAPRVGQAGHTTTNGGAS